MESAIASIYTAGSAERLDDCEEAQVALAPVYTAYFDIQMALARRKKSELRMRISKCR